MIVKIVFFFALQRILSWLLHGHIFTSDSPQSSNNVEEVGDSNNDFIIMTSACKNNIY